MANYTFLDAGGVSRQASAGSVAGGLTPQIEVIGSVISAASNPTSISGVGIFNVNHTGNGSIIALNIGSIISVNNPSSVSGVGLFNVNHTGNGSVLTQVQGSVISVWPLASVAGTYVEDAAHTTGDRGIFALNVRNDTMSSITSADGDYSPMVVGPVGEVIVSNAPLTKIWQAQTSVMYGVSVQALAAQGASVFTYITSAQIANDSGTFSRVKITGGLGSVLAWTVAPANSGSNIVFANPLKTGENSGVSASINGVSSVYVTMQGFISKT